MSSDRSGELIAYARDLEVRDEDVARRIEHAGEVLRRVDDILARVDSGAELEIIRYAA